jgi:hypothetical protein
VKCDWDKQNSLGKCNQLEERDVKKTTLNRVALFFGLLAFLNTIIWRDFCVGMELPLYRLLCNKGLNYYRLKQFDKDNKFFYTPSKLLRFDVAGSYLVKFYPLTYGIVKIDITKAMQQEEIVINVSSAAGMVMNQVKVGTNKILSSSSALD